MRRFWARVLVCALVVSAAIGGVFFFTPRADAASAGVGFGTWAASTPYGWHGSMLIDGVHTYCILPGRPLPTAESTDHGISTDAAGLSPTQLTAVNHLITTYGQTDDPVQAASVGWAVKAIANWDETLHHFGYEGDSLAGAIEWVFSHIAPEHSLAVQNLAVLYYAEATALAPSLIPTDGSLIFSTEQNDPLAGTVTAAINPVGSDAGLRGSITLVGAVFADSDSATRDDVVSGEPYNIRVIVGEDSSAVTVSGSAEFTGTMQPAVRYFTTVDGQDTAGPAGPIELTIEGADKQPRQLTFSPQITTQVATRYASGAAFVDDVTFATADGVWPRNQAGEYLQVSATATVYRTETEPVLNPEGPPADAEAITTLAVQTDVSSGPSIPYRVSSAEGLDRPGFYTAVWRISAAEQRPEVVARLRANYEWIEPFGEQSQLMMVPMISTLAQPEAAVGTPMSDEIMVSGPIPAGGLIISAAVYRAVDGLEPVETCTEQNLVWKSTEPIVANEPGMYSVTAPPVPAFGTYYWQETATDAQGTAVHVGECGLKNETTTAPVPTVTTVAQATAGFGAAVTDTATVDGLVPATGSTGLTFQLYRAEDSTDPAATCTPSNLVFDTAATPIEVTAAGSYVSPAVRVHEAGTHYWIENLWWMPEGSQDQQLLAQGACGLENERTVIETPGLSTQADPRVATGEPFGDVATVTGVAADADLEVIFELYHQSSDEPVCTKDNLEARTEPVSVTGSGDYRSPDVVSDKAGAKFWIAELRYRPTADAEPVVLHRGVCGESGEQTIVDVLAVTGGDDASKRQLGSIGALAVALGLAVLAIRAARPRQAASPKTA